MIGEYLDIILANIKSVWFSGMYKGLWEPIAIWEYVFWIFDWFLNDINLSILYRIFGPYIDNNISLLDMYKKICIEMTVRIKTIDVMRIFLFIFMYFNKDIRMIKYIIIEPVSGSRKVNIEGIIVNIIKVKNDLFFMV